MFSYSDLPFLIINGSFPFPPTQSIEITYNSVRCKQCSDKFCVGVNTSNYKDGRCLIDNGFTNVSHVVSGFEGDLDEQDQRGNVNGWRHDGMPWNQC